MCIWLPFSPGSQEFELSFVGPYQQRLVCRMTDPAVLLQHVHTRDAAVPGASRMSSCTMRDVGRTCCTHPYSATAVRARQGP